MSQDARIAQFFVLGAARCGTSNLYHYLCRHPRLFLPEVKEPEFFSREDLYSRGLDWYSDLYQQAASDQLRGDASTTYTRWPHTGDCAERIAKAVPEARFIYLMRDPVDRAFSHYGHNMRRKVTMSFEEALERSKEYVDCGMYMNQIRRYLRFFAGDRFLFLFLNDLSEAPKRVLEETQQFLGIPPMDLYGSGTKPENASRDEYLRARTTRALRRIPGVSAVADLVPRELRDRLFHRVKHSFVGRTLARGHRIQPMRPETRARLEKTFEQPNRELAEFLQFPLDHWRHQRSRQSQ